MDPKPFTVPEAIEFVLTHGNDEIGFFDAARVLAKAAEDVPKLVELASRLPWYELTLDKYGEPDEQRCGFCGNPHRKPHEEGCLVDWFRKTYKHQD
jgi:hypothetical protein